MAKTPANAAQHLTKKLRDDLDQLMQDARQLELNPRNRFLLNEEIHRSAAALNGLAAELDPVHRPSAVFDPGNPRTVGFFVALAMTAQPRKPLSELKEFYGAGVYALYYKGALKEYAPISASETPIYIGMAVHGAKEHLAPFHQGTPLASRLAEHKKNIQRAGESLDIADFEYRALVVQSGWEGPAETYLIRMFRPLWNRETNILYGFGKHGDSSETRKNKRSPWDTFHAGRKWASGDHQEDAMSLEKITSLVNGHFEKHVVYPNFKSVLGAFVKGLQQTEHPSAGE